MKKLSITECRKFLKDKKNMQFENLYRMINKYVEKYDNYESQYMIQTSSAYRKKVENKPKFRFGDYIVSKKDYNLLLLKRIKLEDITNKIYLPKN